MEPISANIITKDQVGPTCKCIASLLCTQFLGPEDEIVILDTGSSPANWEALKYRMKEIQTAQTSAPKIKLVPMATLSRDLSKYIENWLPMFAGRLEKDEQYKDLRGILDFAGARNAAIKHSTNDLIFWIDSDDVLVEEEPGALRKVVEATMVENKQYSALFLEYKYAFADDGTLTTTLKRERVFRKSLYGWKGRCHETAIPLGDMTGQPQVGFCEDLPSYIVHTEARKTHSISDIRNYIILRKELEELKDGDAADPRTVFYLANAARGLGSHRESIQLYRQFESVSGSPDDRYAAAYYIANIYLHPEIRRPVDAMDWFFKCVEILPFDPRGYFGISRAYLAQEKPAHALHWYEVGRKFPEPKKMLHAYDPTHIHHKPHLVAAQALQRMDRAREAVSLVELALQFKNDKETQDFAKFIKICAAGEQLAESIEHVGMHVKGGGMNAKRLVRKIYEHIPAVPQALEKLGVGKLEEPDPRPAAKDVAIFCGPTQEEWGPRSRVTGIGGSEKMVIILSAALQKRGFNVTIYANVPFPQRGLDKDNVLWRHWSEMDMQRPRHAFVAWRGVQNICLPVPAEKRILWLHDVQHPVNYTKEVLATADYIQFQSQYHLEPVKDLIPEDKIWVARNAVELNPLVWNKDPKKLVYLSCPTRGAVTAMEILRRAQVIDPKLHLTIMYGFSPFERKVRYTMDHRHIPDLGRDAGVDDYERHFGRLADETKTTVLNRVSFKKVSEELLSAGMWLYPTQFPEISCMAAMEAQAHGVIPIASRYGALKETILPEADALCKDIGPVPPGDREEYYKRAAASVVLCSVVAANDPRRAAMAGAASSKFDVELLAAEWAEKLK